MTSWIYRTFFARRVCWSLETRDADGETLRVRVTLYDPSPAAVLAYQRWADGQAAAGWRVVEAPAGGEERS